MASSLLSLANNLSEWIHKIKCKYGHDDKEYESCRIRVKHCNCFLEHVNFKEYIEYFIEHQCLYWNKDYQLKFDQKLKENIFTYSLRGQAGAKTRANNMVQFKIDSYVLELYISIKS